MPDFRVRFRLNAYGSDLAGTPKYDFACVLLSAFFMPSQIIGFLGLSSENLYEIRTYMQKMSSIRTTFDRTGIREWYGDLTEILEWQGKKSPSEKPDGLPVIRKQRP